MRFLLYFFQDFCKNSNLKFFKEINIYEDFVHGITLLYITKNACLNLPNSVYMLYIHKLYNINNTKLILTKKIIV